MIFKGSISVVLAISLMGCASLLSNVGGEGSKKKIDKIFVSEWCCDAQTMTSGTEVTIVGTGPIDHREYTLQDPPLLVIQLKDVDLVKYDSEISVNSGILKRIVPKQLKGKKWTSEIRLDLTKFVDYRIREEDNRLVVSFYDMMPMTPGQMSYDPDSSGLSESNRAPVLLDATSDIKSEGEYVIGPEDVLEISVWKSEDLSRVVTVRPDGMISMPLIGDLQAAGLTPEILRKEIMRKLENYTKVPEVSVIVQQVNSYVIYILGEISSPGKYQLKSHVTLLQAISLAGGFTQFASRNNIKVLRKDIGKKKERTIKIRYKDIVSKDNTGKNILLQSGDTIIIP